MDHNMPRKPMPFRVVTDPDGTSHVTYNGVKRYVGKGHLAPQFGRTRRKLETGTYRMPDNTTIEDPATPVGEA